LSFALGAFVTPGDFLLASMALTAPLYLLYELSVLLTVVIFRKRRANSIAGEGSPIEGAA
jgi:Sec-independent protein secretion pathway component TatC